MQIFSCFSIGVEKNNDDIRRIHLQKSNQWDAAKDVLLVSKRLEALSDLDRKRRTYLKRNSEYWESGIKEKHAAKRENIRNEIERNNAENIGNPIANMTAGEIKSKLNDLGIKTRLRSIKRLQELLTDVLSAST
jgi:E3 ubiquitin-protein ligase DOA10